MAGERVELTDTPVKQVKGWRRSRRSPSNGQFSRMAAANVQTSIDDGPGVDRWLANRNQVELTPWSLRFDPAPQSLMEQSTVGRGLNIGEITGISSY